MCVLGFPFTYFFLPETRGKTLEEIDYLFASGEAKVRLERRFEEAAGRGHRGFRDDLKNVGDEEGYGVGHLELKEVRP